MIRVLVVLVVSAVFAILLLAPWSGRKKFIVAGLLLAGVITLLWFDFAQRSARTGLVAVQQVALCGQQVEHSYRSNFDFSICIKNLADKAIVKRIALQIEALDCVANGCQVIESHSKSVPYALPPGEQDWLNVNLAFEKEVTEPKWQIVITEVWAVP